MFPAYLCPLHVCPQVDAGQLELLCSSAGGLGVQSSEVVGTVQGKLSSQAAPDPLWLTRQGEGTLSSGRMEAAQPPGCAQPSAVHMKVNGNASISFSVSVNCDGAVEMGGH
jgi:hypothetical protein